MSQARARRDRLELRVLGGLGVERGGARLDLPPSKKTRALLGYLIIEQREHTRDQLCALLFDGPDDPRGALRWSLSRLRPLLDEPGTARLLADRERVQLLPLGARVDLLAARELAHRIGTASAEELLEAAGLFRGELLEGLELPDDHRFQAWCVAQREEARRLRGKLLRALCDAQAAQPEESLRTARSLIELEPSAEEAHRRVMRLLHALGRNKQAVEQYDTCREILRSQLGAQPSAETEALRRTIGVGAPAPMVAPAQPQPAPAPPMAKPRTALPLVGRDAERAAVEAALARGRRVLLLADPGLGKTRLLEELAHGIAARGAAVLAGRSYEAELTRPYGCILDALRASPLPAEARGALRADLAALLPELGAPSDAPDRSRLFDAVAALLRGAAGARAVVLLLDDAQWLDEASSALLHYLLRTVPEVAVVLAARGGELPDNAAAERLVHALRRADRLAEVPLPALGPDAVAELLRTRGLRADAGQVHQRSDGNPLFALEVARALDEGRPLLSGRLEEALEQRLQSVEEAAGSLLPWAAALGRAFTPELMAAASARPEPEVVEALLQLERRGVLRALADGSFDFAHDLLREAAYRRIPSAQRRHVHATLARTLWARPDALGPLSATVAHQALLAGDDALAVRSSVAAGQHSLRVSAPDEAVALAERAAPLLAALPREERLRAQLALLQIRVHSRLRASQLDELAAELSALVFEAEACGQSSTVADGLQTLADAYFLLRHVSDLSAVPKSLRGAEAARADADPAVRARALSHAGRCLAQTEREMDRAAKFLDEAAESARSANLPPLLDALLGRGLVELFQGRPEATESLQRAQLAAAGASDHWRHTEALLALVRGALEDDDGAAGVLWGERAVAAAEKLAGGDEPALARALLGLARRIRARQTGAPDPDARELFEAAVEELTRNEARFRLLLVSRAHAEVALREGRLDEAEAQARKVRTLEVQTEFGGHGLSDLCLAEIALARGDARACRAHLKAALDAAGSTGDLSARFRARVAAAARAAEQSDVKPKEAPCPATSSSESSPSR
jgi:DNA-binding SARP family transcriptional activator